MVYISNYNKMAWDYCYCSGLSKFVMLHYLEVSYFKVIYLENFPSYIQNTATICAFPVFTYDLLNEGYQYVTTAKLLNDSVKHFSQYRQMHHDRFIAN